MTPYEPVSGNFAVRLDANESFLSLSDTIKAELAEKRARQEAEMAEREAKQANRKESRTAKKAEKNPETKAFEQCSDEDYADIEDID